MVGGDVINPEYVRQISSERLAEFERRVGTGHTAIDVANMACEIRRLSTFLREEAERLAHDGHHEAAQRLLAASKVPWE